MYQQHPSRNQRTKGYKVKYVFQVALLLAVSIWLIYQIMHFHEKRKAYAGEGENNLGKGFRSTGIGRIVKLESDNKIKADSDNGNSDDGDKAKEGGDDLQLQENVVNHQEEEDEKMQEVRQGPQKYEEESNDAHIKESGKEEGTLEVEPHKHGEENSDNRESIEEGEKDPETQQEAAQKTEEETLDIQIRDTADGKVEKDTRKEEPHMNEEDKSYTQIRESEGGEREKQNQDKEAQGNEKTSDTQIEASEEGTKEQEISREEVQSNEEKIDTGEAGGLDKEIGEDNNSNQNIEENMAESNETSERIQDFSDENNVQKDVVSFLPNETTSENQVKSSEDENISGSDTQMEHLENTAQRGGQIFNTALGTEQSNIEMPTDNEVLNKEAVESQGDGTYGAENTRNVALEDAKNDTFTDGKTILESVETTELNNIEVPTDNMDLNNQELKSQEAENDTKVEGTANETSEGLKHWDSDGQTTSESGENSVSSNEDLNLVKEQEGGIASESAAIILHEELKTNPQDENDSPNEISAQLLK